MNGAKVYMVTVGWLLYYIFGPDRLHAIKGLDSVVGRIKQLESEV